MMRLFFLWQQVEIKSTFSCYNSLKNTILISIFPETAVQFPRNFIAILKGICSKLFRILAIIFCCHLTILEELGAIPHLNTTFEHFLFFCWEFDMIKKCEEEALGDLIDDIRYRNSSD